MTGHGRTPAREASEARRGRAEVLGLVSQRRENYHRRRCHQYGGQPRDDAAPWPLRRGVPPRYKPRGTTGYVARATSARSNIVETHRTSTWIRLWTPCGPTG